MAGLKPKLLQCGILLGETEQRGSPSLAAMREVFCDPNGSE
jgi:hypothetical protein